MMNQCIFEWPKMNDVLIYYKPCGRGVVSGLRGVSGRSVVPHDESFGRSEV